MAEKPVVTRGGAGESESRLLTQVFHSFVSMRTGIFLLVLLMAASFLGTFIPPGRQLALVGDVYHTWWFRLLLGILCINIFACSARRLPALWKSTVTPEISPVAKLDSLPNYRKIAAKSSLEGAAVTAAILLAKQGFHVKIGQDGVIPVIYADRGRLAPWGTFAVHLSILVIMIGALYGNLYGVSRDIALPVGSSVEITNVEYPGVDKPFILRLNHFTTEYYEDGAVSDWVSDITVAQNGQDVLTREVKVNQPLNFNGVTVYQFYYGTTLHTQFFDSQGNMIKEAGVAEREMLESNGIVVRPVRFIPDFNPTQPMVSLSPELRNPHVLYIIYYNGREVDWGAAKIGDEVSLGKNLGTVKFTAAQPFSGLQVKQDPGVPVVWCGFIMMTIGFFMSLYTRRLRLWVTIAPSDGFIKVEAGGVGSQKLFVQFMDRLSEHMVSKTVNGRKP